MNAAGALALFVITRTPLGQTAGGAQVYGTEGGFTVREHVWRGTKSIPRAPIATSMKTIEEARAALHKASGRGLEQLLRQTRDVPELVECWGAPLVVKYLRHQGRLT